MISTLDLNIYKAIFQKKNITEKYIGYTIFDWVYSEVHYTADCTLGIAFDVFDKVIVGILKVDEVLSIIQIGEILGMNLIDNPKELQYKDEAEYDILRMALDNLKNYEMIETGDIYYSACRLTMIGNEYAQKGRKFKYEGNKPFSIWFDHTSNQHIEAKKQFQRLIGKNMDILMSDISNYQEAFLKEVAAYQLPEIYDIEKGNSFTRPQINRQNSKTYILKLYIALLFDIESKQFSLEAYEPNVKKILPYFSQWLNEYKKEELIMQFFQENKIDTEDFNLNTQNNYFEQLIAKKKDLEGFEKDKIPQLFTSVHQEMEFIDIEYFWNNIFSFFTPKTKEVFFLIPDISIKIIELFNQLIEKENIPILYFILQKSEKSGLIEAISTLNDNCKQVNNNVFLAIYGRITAFTCWFIEDETVKCFTLKKFGFKYQENFTSKAIIQQADITKLDIEGDYYKIKDALAGLHLPIIADYIQEKIAANVPDTKLSKPLIESYNTLDIKAKVFVDLQHNESALKQIFQIEKSKKLFIQQLKERHKVKLLAAIQQLQTDFNQQTFSQLSDLNPFYEKIKTIGIGCFEEYSDLKVELNKFADKIKETEIYIREEILAKTYIIDTNVFIAEPNILSIIDKKHYIALTLTVIEELDRLKTRESTKESAIKAIRNINEMLQQSNKQKKARIKKARADLTLLPMELQQKSADNYLLSMALVYKNENPIILTIDRNLQSKAMMLNISIQTMDDFYQSKLK